MKARFFLGAILALATTASFAADEPHHKTRHARPAVAKQVEAPPVTTAEPPPAPAPLELTLPSNPVAATVSPSPLVVEDLPPAPAEEPPPLPASLSFPGLRSGLQFPALVQPPAIPEVDPLPAFVPEPPPVAPVEEKSIGWIPWLLALFSNPMLYVLAALAVLAALYILLMARQTRTLRKSADNTERALIKLERPWLFVSMQPDTYRDSPMSRGGRNEPPPVYVKFNISNHGRFPATIEDCYVGACAGPVPDAMPREDLRGAITPGEAIKDCREYFPRNLEYTAVAPFGDTSKTIEIPKGEDVFVYVFVRYTGLEREPIFESKFCWKWNARVFRWVQFNDDRYNRRT